MSTDVGVLKSLHSGVGVKMRKLIITALVGILIGTVGSQFALKGYRYVRHTYFTEVRPLAKGLRYYDTRMGIFEMSTVRQADVIMFGDSNIQLGKWSEWTGCKSLVNRGIGGDITKRMLKRIDTVLDLNPKAIFFMGGVNDVVKAIPLSETVANLDAIMSRLANSGAEIYMTHVFNVTSEYNGTGWPNQFIDSMNDEIVTLSKKYRSITMIDLKEELAPGGILKPEYAYDNMHFVPASYKIWLNRVGPLIKEHCSGS